MAMPSSKPILNIVTDDKGFCKFVTFMDRSIPTTEATIYLSGHDVAQVELTVQPVQLDVSAELGTVSMECPVCSIRQVHRCYEDDDDNCQD
jgi:hypothetical protein